MTAALPIAAALLSVIPQQAGSAVSLSEAKARLGDVRWTGDSGDALAVGSLGDLSVVLTGTQDAVTAIGFYWQETAERPPYAIVEALRASGARVTTIGCPQFSSASEGREAIGRIEFAERVAIALTVYEREAPTAIDASILDVDADLTGRIPTAAALRAGDYPGGGGRAWATEPIGWPAACTGWD